MKCLKCGAETKISYNKKGVLTSICSSCDLLEGKEKDKAPDSAKVIKTALCLSCGGNYRVADPYDKGICQLCERDMDDDNLSEMIEDD